MEVRGVPVTGSSLIRGVLHCLGPFQSKLKSTQSLVVWLQGDTFRKKTKKNTTTGTNGSHVHSFKCDMLKKLLEGT